MLSRLSKTHNPFSVFGSGAAIGTLGGAEFRLPLLIGAFGFDALDAVILNKAISLVVVATALPFRAATVPVASVMERWDVSLRSCLAVSLALGSLIGASLGGRLLGIVPTEVLLQLLSAILVISSVKVWLHA